MNSNFLNKPNNIAFWVLLIQILAVMGVESWLYLQNPTDKKIDIVIKASLEKAQVAFEKEKQKIRNQEIDEGKLVMPKEPNILYVLNGAEANYNKTTGELKDGNIRYAFYVPYATQESTGMSTKPSIPGMPWLMEAGTAKAHIMIVPPKKQ